MAKGVEFMALYEVGLAMASVLDLNEVGEEILSRAMMLLECPMGALYLLDGTEFTLASSQADAIKRFSMSEVDVDALRLGRDGLGIRPLIDAASVLAVPIERDGTVRGLLVVGSASVREAGIPKRFSGDNRRTLSLFASQAAIAINTAHLHQVSLEHARTEQDVRVAASIQRRILPEAMPRIPGFEIIGWSRPARTVGGDYYTVGAFGEGRWATVVGDVAGKGIPAALLVSTFDSALRLLLQESIDSVDIMRRLNEHMVTSTEPGRFITAAVGILDPARRSFSHVSAGHNPTIMISQHGGARLLEASGTPLGVVSGASYEPTVVELAPGDLVCLYSDGITECMSPEYEQFGLDRLLTLLTRESAAPLATVLERLDHELRQHARRAPQSDDQTIVMLRCSAE